MSKFLSNFSFYFLFQATNIGFQLLLLPVLINRADSSSIAIYFIILSLSTLLSIFVNFGTNVTAIIDLEKNTDTSDRLPYSTAFNLRTLPLLMSTLILFVVAFLSENKSLFVLSYILVFAEFFSPLFYLLYKHNLKTLFSINLVLKAFAFYAIFHFDNHIHLVAFAVAVQGISTLVLNLLMLLAIKFQYNLLLSLCLNKTIVDKSLQQMPLVGNNLITQLQQSIFLFSIPAIASPVFVAAYGFIDKIVSAIRMLVTTYNISFFPQANREFNKGADQWRQARSFQNRIISTVSLLAAIPMFLFPDKLIHLLLLGGSPQSQSFIQTASMLLQLIALIPLIIALNALNVAEIMMNGLFKKHFIAGILVLGFTLLASALARFLPDESLLGYYPLCIETVTLLIYLFLVYSQRKKELVA